MWDIREAALKRCASINSRRDYTLIDSGLSKMNGRVDAIGEKSEESMDDEVANYIEPTENSFELPPIPQPNQRSADAVENDPPNLNRNETGLNGIIVPPLPVGAESGVGDGGAFVSNGEIDEGVSLLSLLQHGDLPPGNDQFTGAETRARSKAVNVVCLTRCPIGGHFATGSDDGVGRVWLDSDDKELSHIDDSLREDNTLVQMQNACTLSRSQTRDTYQRTSNRGE
jgi:hypothetical protein